MKKTSGRLISLAASVLKFEIMGKFFAAAVTLTVLGIASSIEKQGFVLNQILVCLVYFPSFYSVLWREGNKSKNSGERFKGLRVGLLASTPYFLSTLIIIILKLLGSSASILWYRIVNVQYISIYTEIFPGNNLNEIGWGAIIICFAVQLLLPLMTQLSYTLGRKHFSFSERIVYKRKPQ